MALYIPGMSCKIVKHTYHVCKNASGFEADNLHPEEEMQIEKKSHYPAW